MKSEIGEWILTVITENGEEQILYLHQPLKGKKFIFYNSYLIFIQRTMTALPQQMDGFVIPVVLRRSGRQVKFLK